MTHEQPGVTGEARVSSSGPEIFIGLVGAVGTELDRITTLLKKNLDKVRYTSSSIRVAKLLGAIPRYKSLPKKYVDEYIDSHMSAGNDFRKLTTYKEAVATLGVSDVIAIREEDGCKPGEIIPNRAYIFRSLKHPAEVKSLREIYGDSFYLVSAYSPYQRRRDHVAKRIARSRNEFPFDRHHPVTDCLILRDQEESDISYGQNTRDTFHRADIFLDMSDSAKLESEVSRFIELIFGNTFHTPTKAEYGMFHAQAAALRSAELGRQVGAAIATDDGDIVAVGTNEVPKAHGGLYWAGDSPDRREFREGYDSNEEHKRNLIAETLEFLRKSDWLNPEKITGDISEVVNAALNPHRPVFPKEAKIRNVIEFGRAVHGEMAALSDAARRGVSVAGCDMYVTTFPCHLCARHIVAAGIRKVIYIEPYARSLTAELYPDSVLVDGGERLESQIPFDAFMGIAPRQYMTLFKMATRKNSTGEALTFAPSAAKLRYYQLPRVYLENEDAAVKKLRDEIKAKGIFQEEMKWRPVCGRRIGSQG